VQPAPPPQPPPGHLPPGYYPGYPPPPGFAPKKTSLVWLWIALGVVGAVAVIGALAAIAIPSFVNYQRKAKAVEAELALRRIGQAAIMHYEEHGRFPEAAAGPTPAAPCCLGPGQKCAPAIETWAIEPWRTLGFTMLEPHRFQYTFTPSADGRSFTATAIGDLDCDGVATTLTITGAGSGGAAQLEAVERPVHLD